MSDFIFMVQVNPVEGKSRELDEWLDGHVDDVLETPGIVAAQRYRLEQVHSLPDGLDQPFEFATIYEIEGDFEKALAALKVASQSRPKSPHMGQTKFNCFYKPIGERRTERN